MMYFADCHIVYMAVPKTASVAIETAFNPHATIWYNGTDLSMMHMNSVSIRKLYGNCVEIIATIREPLEWLRSFHRYLAGPSFNIRCFDTTHIRFERFVEKYINGEILWPEPYRTQSEYISNGVNHLFIYDKLPTCIDFLNNKLGLAINVPLVNVSPQRPADISKELINKLHQYIADDYQLYNDVKKNTSST